MHGSEVKPGERVKDVHFTEDTIAVDLTDGRTIVVPLAWYPTLLEASPEQRSNWKKSGAGYGIHWPDIDEERRLPTRLRGDRDFCNQPRGLELGHHPKRKSSEVLQPLRRFSVRIDPGDSSCRSCYLF